MNARVQKPMEWPADGQSLYGSEPVQHMDVSSEFSFLPEGVYSMAATGPVREGAETLAYVGTWSPIAR